MKPILHSGQTVELQHQNSFPLKLTLRKETGRKWQIDLCCKPCERLLSASEFDPFSLISFVMFGRTSWMIKWFHSNSGSWSISLEVSSLSSGSYWHIHGYEKKCRPWCYLQNSSGSAQPEPGRVATEELKCIRLHQYFQWWTTPSNERDASWLWCQAAVIIQTRTATAD